MNGAVMEIRIADDVRLGAFQIEFEGPVGADAEVRSLRGDSLFFWRRDEEGLRAMLWNPDRFSGLASDGAIVAVRPGTGVDLPRAVVTVADTAGVLLFRGRLPVEHAAGSTVPAAYLLRQNYPNPFNPSTRVTFDVPQPSSVRLAVFDIVGREVQVLVDGPVGAGRHEVSWMGVDRRGIPVAGGVYFCRFEAFGDITGARYVQTAKMLLLK
jgi:hypothetical protein